jgi:hypothetical protein
MMKLKGTVKDGSVAVDLPEGTPVTVEVVPLEYVIDDGGSLVITEKEEEREILLAEAEADRGEGLPWQQAMAEIRRDADTLALAQRSRRLRR